MSELKLPKSACDYIEDLRSIIYSIYPNILSDDEITFGHINKDKKSYGLLSHKSYQSPPLSLLYFHSFYGENGPHQLINEFNNKMNILSQMFESHGELTRRVSRDLYIKYDKFLKDRSEQYKNITKTQQIFLYARNSVHQLDNGNIIDTGKMKEQNIIKTLKSIVNSLDFEVEDDLENKKIEIFSSGQRACFELIIYLTDSYDISSVKMSFAVDEDIFEHDNINNEVCKLLKEKQFQLLKRKFQRLKAMETLIDENEEMHFEKSGESIMNIINKLPAYISKNRVCEGPQITYYPKYLMTFLGNEVNWRLKFVKNETFDYNNYVYLFELTPPIVIPIKKLLSLSLGPNCQHNQYINEEKLSNNQENIMNGVTYIQAILHHLNTKQPSNIISQSMNASLQILTYVDHMNYKIDIHFNNNTCEECYIVSHLPLISISYLSHTIMKLRSLVIFNQLIQSLFHSFDILDTENEVKNNIKATFNLNFVDFQTIHIQEQRYIVTINIQNEQDNDNLYDVQLDFQSSKRTCSNKYATKVLSLSHSIPTMLHYINKSFS